VLSGFLLVMLGRKGFIKKSGGNNMWSWILTQTAKFSFTKFLGGFNILNGEKLGKIIFTIIIVLGCLFVINKFFTPKNVSNTDISGNQSVIVQQCDPKSLDKLIGEARAQGRNSALIKLWFIRLF